MATTGFEDRVAAEEFPDWTTNAEELTYLTALALEFDTLTFEVAGQSEQGKDMHLVRVGHPTAPVGPGGPCVLIVSEQHGPEGAGREAAFKFMRTLAGATGDRATYLQGVTWLFLPTCNPDGLGTTRNNSNDINLNRDHAQLSQKEAQTVHEIIRDYRPQIVIDAHEALDYTSNFDHSFPRHPMTHPGISSMSQDLIAAFVARATLEGWTSATYWTAQEEDRLTNMAGLRHAVSALIETPRTSTPNQISRAWRVGIQVAMFDELLEFDISHRAEIAATTEASRAAAIEAGESGGTVIDLRLATIDPAPRAYSLTADDMASTATTRDLFDIRSYGPGVVPMGQEAAFIIPMVMDGSAEFKTVAATRLSTVPADLDGLIDAQIHNITGIETQESDPLEFEGTAYLRAYSVDTGDEIVPVGEMLEGEASTEPAEIGSDGSAATESLAAIAVQMSAAGEAGRAAAGSSAASLDAVTSPSRSDHAALESGAQLAAADLAAAEGLAGVGQVGRAGIEASGAAGGVSSEHPAALEALGRVAPVSPAALEHLAAAGQGGAVSVEALGPVASVAAVALELVQGCRRTAAAAYESSGDAAISALGSVCVEALRALDAVAEASVEGVASCAAADLAALEALGSIRRALAAAIESGGAPALATHAIELLLDAEHALLLLLDNPRP